MRSVYDSRRIESGGLLDADLGFENAGDRLEFQRQQLVAMVAGIHAASSGTEVGSTSDRDEPLSMISGLSHTGV